MAAIFVWQEGWGGLSVSCPAWRSQKDSLSRFLITNRGWIIKCNLIRVTLNTFKISARTHSCHPRITDGLRVRVCTVHVRQQGSS